MPLNYEKLMGYEIPDEHMDVIKRDTMLYALGIGLGADPLDERQLRFVYEKNLQAVPTMAAVIAAPHAWIRKADVGFGGKSVHAGIELVFERPLPVEGSFYSKNRVSEVLDKGPGKAALVTTERRIFDRLTDELVFTVNSTSMLRGDGGFGGVSQGTSSAPGIPERPSDGSVIFDTLPQAGLIYRLSGDYNPLHADPEVARAAGFPRPILHGLCTYGIAGHALLRECCDYQPERLKAIQARFSSPVYPGEPLGVEIWRENKAAHFRVTAPQREHVVVLDHGYAEFA